MAYVLKGCWLALHGKSLCGSNRLGGRRPQNQVENKTESCEQTEDEKYYTHHHDIDAEVVGKSSTDATNDLVVCVAVETAAAVFGLCRRFRNGLSLCLGTEVLGLAQSAHRCLHIQDGNDLGAGCRILAEQFGDARLNVGEHLLAAFGSGQVAAKGFEVGRKNGVGVLIHVKEHTAQIDVNGLFHEFLREFTASTKAVHSEFSASSRMRPFSVSW